CKFLKNIEATTRSRPQPLATYFVASLTCRQQRRSEIMNDFFRIRQAVREIIFFVDCENLAAK
ncbi:hypothetical protein, partial [Roseateles sp.]|uniref:hypothetical protein n=1 Tax=Roseateles sp. TaxID=1971397 RepID=UPI002F40FF02